MKWSIDMMLWSYPPARIGETEARITDMNIPSYPFPAEHMNLI